MGRRRIRATALLLAVLVVSANAPSALAVDEQKLDRSAGEALKSLNASNTAARLLGEKARAVLVFPNIVKAGFMFGGQVGNGVLMKRRQGRPATTTRSRRRTASRPACRSSATRCSS